MWFALSPSSALHATRFTLHTLTSHYRLHKCCHFLFAFASKSTHSSAKRWPAPDVGFERKCWLSVRLFSAIRVEMKSIYFKAQRVVATDCSPGGSRFQFSVSNSNAFQRKTYWYWSNWRRSQKIASPIIEFFRGSFVNLITGGVQIWRQKLIKHFPPENNYLIDHGPVNITFICGHVIGKNRCARWFREAERHEYFGET